MLECYDTSSSCWQSRSRGPEERHRKKPEAPLIHLPFENEIREHREEKGVRVMNRVKMLAALAGLVMAFLPLLTEANPPPQAPEDAGETLYNGIRLPASWPPRLSSLPQEPLTPPYLLSPPPVIPIDTGRQLFVDDFLIEEASLNRTFHAAKYHPSSPVLKPDRPWEQEGQSPTAMVFSDGVWYDPQDRLFKMWYMGGYVRSTCYATSPDGIQWEKPSLDVRPGTNIVQAGERDSATVWLDLEEKDPQRRFKMFRSHGDGGWALSLYFSPDGVHWCDAVARSGPCGDRTTVFYNPFRRVWVYSIRAGAAGFGRIRRYWESPDVLEGARWKQDEPVLWVGADRLDPPRKDLDVPPQLYNLDAVAYESVLLGLFSIWRGQPKDRAKPNEVLLGFSRDGFHWHRPCREAFIPVSERHGDWNWCNVQSAGGGCLVVRDQLYFYVSARAGIRGSSISGVCSTGLATLRRDGFASMDADESGGTLTTRPVRFRGKHLFVNVDAPAGELRVEVLDEKRQVVPPFSRENCIPVQADSTIHEVTWSNANDLTALTGRPVRFRFHLRNGRLYSFWVSPDRSGASHGYVAAGGPGFTGPTDTVGITAVERRFSQADIPAFWKGRVEDVEEAVRQVKRGKAQVIARSPGGRPVHLVAYGPHANFQRQANYNSAAAAGDPGFYARKPLGTPPVVFIVGPPHGHEVEGMVGLVNLVQVAETGKDCRGKEWPRLRTNLDGCRVLIVPLSNPDGRARCPYDSFVGIPVKEMTRVGQGTQKDGTPYGWPGAKRRHPMQGDVGLLGAYFNDDGINLMHDEFFKPMAEETAALLRVAREEAPDYIINLHSHASAPAIIRTSYVPRYCKETEAQFAKRLMERYRQAGLPAGNPPVPAEDGEKYPPPSFNLTSALHHVCGGVSTLFECPHGVEETRYPQVTHDEILDIELILFEEFLAFALEFPGPRSP